MTFSNEWEEAYKRGEQLSIWPWSDLVSCVMRYSKPNAPHFRVLELGFGAGANIRFFLELGVEYFGIEGSASIVERVQKKYPQIKNRLIAGDFTREIPFEGEFDLIVDRSSITHASTAAIQNCLKILKTKMKPHSKYIGIDWFSSKHSDIQYGTADEDERTRTGFTHGQFKGIGQVHFSDEGHLRDLFKDFQIQLLEEKTSQRFEPKDNWLFASWNIVAQRL